jgi:hypothetical protein
MSKYNILHDEEGMEKKEPTDSAQKQNQSDSNQEATFEPPLQPTASETKQTPGDEYFSDELFPVNSQADIDTDSPKKQETEENPENLNELNDQGFVAEPELNSGGNINYEETAESEYPLAEKKNENQPLFEYEEDEKQEGLNYKPILIGGVIVVAIIALYFIISSIFFGEKETEVTQQPTETAQQKLAREQDERKQNFLVEKNHGSNYNLKSIHQLASYNQTGLKYSSILLYGNSLNLEVFVPDREVLAKYNLKVKNDKNVETYDIEKVSQRRGSKGGLLALYNINLKKNPPGSSQVRGNPVKVTPETWSNQVVVKAGMRISSSRSISSRQENLFRVSRIEYDLRGSIDNSLSLINQLASSNMNIFVHKLTLMPTDQQSMSNSSYVLKLIIDFYL